MTLKNALPTLLLILVAQDNVVYSSQWSSWSPCTKSCGIGVSSSVRNCSRTMVNCVEKKNIRYRTCNTEDCTNGEPEDFRALQCAAYNDHDGRGGKLREWVPVNGGDIPSCFLTCRVKGSDIVEVKSPRVMDGTLCAHNSNDVCIDGVCHAVGCDRELHSRKRKDVCGVCGGNGKSCRLVTGLYRSKPDKTKGVELVVTIPRSSHHISLSERGSGHIGLKSTASQLMDVVTSNVTDSLSNRITTRSGLSLRYRTVYDKKEIFDVSGPIPDEMQVMALYNEAVWKYIRYEFYRPLVVMWIHNETSMECTKTCGNGLLFIRPICVDVVTLERRNESDCYEEKISPPAPKVRRCNLDPCPSRYEMVRSDFSFEFLRGPRWIDHPWTECSASCGGGFQTRSVSCMDVSDEGGSYFSQNDAPCHRTNTSSPETRRRCNEHLCPRWQHRAWSACSATCGIGVRHRVVTCLSHDGGPGYNCANDTKPATVRSCLASVLCTRKPTIPSFAPPRIHYSQSALLKPRVTTVSFFPNWNSGPWSGCSVTCGSGVISRTVKCQYNLKFSLTTVTLPDVNCSSQEKPEKTKRCALPRCMSDDDVTRPTLNPEGTDVGEGHTSVDETTDATTCNHSLCTPQGGARRWELGPFTPCSVTCGRGTQHRLVTCRELPEGENSTTRFSTGEAIPGMRRPEVMCPLPKPHKTQDCSQSPCPPQWISGPWGKCSRDCGKGFQNRTVQCTQRLGNGKVVQVGSDYCSHGQPKHRRLCVLRRVCPERLHNNHRLRCSSNCISSYRRRISRCLQLESGRSRSGRGRQRCVTSRVRLAMRKCKRRCNGQKNRPKIHTSTKRLIQGPSQHKMVITIGQQAFVRPDSLIIIKCRVDRFPRSRIRWYHNGALLSVGVKRTRVTGTHIFPQSNGSLRIVGARISDRGKYACSAGSSFARSVVYIVPGIQTVTPQNTVPPEVEDERNRVLIDVINNNDVDEIDSLGHLDDIRHSPPLLYEPPLNRVGHSGLAFFEAPLVIDARPFFVNGNAPPRPPADNPQTPSPVRISPDEEDSHILRAVQQYLNEDHRRNSLKQVDDVLEDVVSTFTSFKRGLMNDEQLMGRSRRIADQLTNLISEEEGLDGNHTAQAVQLRNIIQLLRERTNAMIAPQIVTHPTLSPIYRESDVTAYVGGNLMITQAERVTVLCETIGRFPADITWYRDGEELLANQKFLLLQEGSLRILRPRYRDSGTYTCVASNHHGNDSKSTSLAVMRKPRIRSIVATHRDFDSDLVDVIIGSDIRAKLGAKIVIRCPTDSYPDSFVVWRKDGAGLGKNTKVLTDNSLQISPTTTADQGLFSCEASNPAGSDYQASSLVLIDPPHLSERLGLLSTINGEAGLPELLQTGLSTENHFVKANTSILMGCPVSGFPQPQITWLFNNQSMAELGSILDYQLMEEDRVLQIPNFDAESEGTFVCHAMNDAANLTSSLQLTLAIYSYSFGEMTSCSASCGRRGTQMRRTRCLRNNEVEVDDWYCNDVTPPLPSPQPCNRVDCPPRYVHGEWSACSTSCGKGIRVRAPSCVVEMSDGSTREVANESCLDQENVTIETKPCHESNCARWRASSWSSCSRKCVKRGVGEKTRILHCISSNGTVIHRMHCSGAPRPKRKSYCRNNGCIPVWLVGRWSACSKYCGVTGIRTRAIKCVYKSRREPVASSQCSRRRRPRSRLRCNRRRCSTYGKSTGGCIDQFSWCPTMKKSSRCALAVMRRVCCRSCSRR